MLTLSAPTQRAKRQWRRNILDRINRFRAQYSLAPLKLNDRLNCAAQTHADDMATRARACARYAGENKWILKNIKPTV